MENFILLKISLYRMRAFKKSRELSSSEACRTDFDLGLNAGLGVKVEMHGLYFPILLNCTIKHRNTITGESVLVRCKLTCKIVFYED